MTIMFFTFYDTFCDPWPISDPSVTAWSTTHETHDPWPTSYDHWLSARLLMHKQPARNWNRTKFFINKTCMHAELRKSKNWNKMLHEHGIVTVQLSTVVMCECHQTYHSKSLMFYWSNPVAKEEKKNLTNLTIKTCIVCRTCEQYKGTIWTMSAMCLLLHLFTQIL